MTAVGASCAFPDGNLSTGFRLKGTFPKPGRAAQVVIREGL